jgi:transcriptional regulator with XRE-family HTH domain
LGDTLRRARCTKGWSIEQLSKRSGVPGRLIRETEGGSSTYVPSQANTVLLAEALRMPTGVGLYSSDVVEGTSVLKKSALSR